MSNPDDFKISVTSNDGSDESGSKSANATDSPSRDNAPAMFDRIAGKYDRLNHLLSLNRDKAWRQRVSSLLSEKQNQTVLDLATGTGDQLLALYRSGRVSRGFGTDPAENMLAMARRKITAAGLDDRLKLQTGRGEELPFSDNCFDAITIAFGIRNVTDVDRTLREMHRVLVDDGRAIILEFSLPDSRLIRAAHLFYLRRIIPLLGGMISKNTAAYKYLDKTIETFPFGEAFTKLMQQTGFKNTHIHPLTFGVASIYVGEK